MKKLFLIRHAKASQAEQGQSDFDRPLNERGNRDAAFLASELKKNNARANELLASPSKRTHATAEYFARALGIEAQVRYDPHIYQASLWVLLKILTENKDSLKTIIMVGHNPGISQLASYLIGETLEFPTCGIAEIELNIEKWSEASRDSGKLLSFDFPKNHFPKN